MNMNSVAYFYTSLFCLGTLQSLSSAIGTHAPTLIKLVHDSWNETDVRNVYSLPSSAGNNQSQVPDTTTFESVPPNPPDGYWNVTDGNITCIRAHLKIRFKIEAENGTRYLVLPPNADSSKSSCGISKTDQILLLHIDKKFDLAFTFEKDLQKHYVLKNITLTIFSPEGANHFYNDIKLFTVQNHYSFWCKSLITVSMNNALMESFEMHIQAFGGSEKDFAVAKICEDDDKLSSIVTIIVSCTLTSLFVSIFIAYVIQQRKGLRQSDSIRLIQNRKTGLNSDEDMSSF